VNDGWPWIVGPLVLFGVFGVSSYLAGFQGLAMALYAAGLVLAGFMLYFFRDPERAVPQESGAIVAGADGLVRAIEEFHDDRYLMTDVVRISIFLSPFNVHVNRSPMAGVVKELAYTPGQHLLTIMNAASERNEHSSILIEGGKTRCLVKQIVGPIVRRVVYWLKTDQPLGKGERIGMMKFGSRLDMYFPKSDVKITVRKGDSVTAGVTVVATLTKE
jgi:phosphatidylserine decarboxylase